VLAAGAAKLHGLTFTLAILDELQAHSKLDVYEGAEQRPAQAGRREDGGVLEAAEAVRELAEAHVIAEVTYDAWRAAQLGQELAERGITASSYPQTYQRAIPASARLHDAILRQNKLVLPDDPELRQHAANAIARHMPRGWRIEAPDRSSNIDGIVALIMALDRFEKPARVAEAARLVVKKPCLTCGRLTTGS